MAGIEEVNKKELETELLIASAVVKALYPSLDIDFASEIVAKTFYESDYKFEEIDTRELSLYLALNLKPQELEAENIKQYVHKRKYTRGAPTKITGCALDNNIDKRYSPWLEPEQTPDDKTSKRMLAIALK